MPTNPNRGWRVGSDPNEGKRAWRKEAAAAPPRRRWTIRALFWPLLLLFLATVGTLIYVATRLAPPTPAYLVVLGADYADNLGMPANLYGWQSAQALRDFAGGKKWPFLWWTRDLFGGQAGDRGLYTLQSQRTEDWADGLAACKEETVLLFVSLHAGVDHQGLFFLPQDANPYDLEERRVLAKVLRLKELLEKLPKDKKKLVLLDVTAAPAWWPLGQLHNDFAAQLAEELKEYQATPDLVVLSACEKDQRAWASEEWGRSVFGHFVLEALSGKADADASKRVDAAELAKFVQEKVEGWARANRDEGQTPVLWKSDGARPEKMELVVVTGEANVPDAKPVSREKLDELKKVWGECQALRGQTPSPAVYAPHLWRQYLDTLLRYEQVVRAGGLTKKADHLLVRLGKLHGDIDKARQVRLNQLSNLVAASLPMHAALGLPETTAGKVLKEVKAAEQILKQQAEDHEKAYAKLQAVQPDGARQPVEAHTLLILHQHRNRTLKPTAANQEPKRADLALAVRVGVLAEETALAVGSPPAADPKKPGASVGPLHPSSERIHPWIKEDLAKADALRREGLDWLLGASAKHFENARAKLKEAAKEYDELLGKVAVLRKAYALRDEILAELPYYTQWLARVRFSPDKNVRDNEKKEFDPAYQAVQKLWNEVHLLSLRLRTPDLAGVLNAPAPTKLEENPPSLKKRLESIWEDWQNVQKTYRSWSPRREGSAALQSPWHQIEAKLATPFLPADERVTLLQDSKSIAADLQSGYEARPAAAAPKSDPDLGRAAAEHQGRLALAALGRVWLAEQAKKGGGVSYDNLLARVSDPSARERQHAGEQIGRLWRELPRAVRKLADEITSPEEWAGSRKPKDFLAAIAPKLVEAEAWCRQLDGAAAESWSRPRDGSTAGLEYDPVADNRCRQLHDLFLAQARRAWDDHWWCTTSDHLNRLPPYFETAVSTYLAAAGELIVQEARDRTLQGLRRHRAQAARDELPRSSVGCDPVGDEKLLTWTTERAMPVAWTLNSKGVPPGIAMLRLLPDRYLVPASEEENYDARAEHRLADAAGPRSYRLALRPDPDEKTRKRYRKPDEAHARLEGVFRGQPIGNDTQINIYREPDTVVYHTPPQPYAGIAVRSDQDHRGAVTLILDFSDSMKLNLKGEEPKKEGDEPAKFTLMLKALEDVLRQLPRGTRLSLWTFGHQPWKGEEEADAKKTKIEPVDEPVIWDLDKHPEQFDRLMRKVRERKPGHWTPIVESMLKAKKDLVDQPGMKTLLVLTDGADTLFNYDLQKKAKIMSSQEKSQEEIRKIRKIRQTLHQNFTAKDNIVVNMLLFGNDADTAIASAQFEETVKTMPAGGNWFHVTKAPLLVRDLLKAARPRMRLLDQDGNVIGDPDGYNITFRDEESLAWSLPLKAEQAIKGSIFQAWVHNQYQHVQLRQGERLVILLKPGQDGIRFERGLFADLFGKHGRTINHLDWRLCVLQNREIGNSGTAVELMMSVENWKNVSPPPPAAGQNYTVLEQMRRGFLWLELTANGEPRPGLRWGGVWNYPGPTWMMNHDNWQATLDGKPAPPELNVWWQGDPKPAVGRRFEHNNPMEPFERALSNRETKLGGTDVVLESVTYETHPVEGQPGGAGCLVVRLRHKPAGHRVWVSLDGIEARGSQHHYYAEAGKVTAFFWHVTRTQAQQGFAVELSSLDQFKKNALHVDSKTFKLRTPNVEKGPGRIDLVP